MKKTRLSRDGSRVPWVHLLQCRPTETSFPRFCFAQASGFETRGKKTSAVHASYGLKTGHFLTPVPSGKFHSFRKYSTSANELHVPLANPEVTGFTPEDEEEWAEKFNRVLETAQPDQVMAMMIHPRSRRQVAMLPDTVFVEAFRLLTPEHFIIPFRDIHHGLHPWSSLLAGIKRLESRFDKFTHNLSTIREYRLDGSPFGLAEYTHILACAASMGNEPFMHDMWHSMFHEKIRPDAVCGTHFMHGLVWSHCYDGGSAYRLRPLERNLRKRSFTQWQTLHKSIRGPDYAGYGTGIYDVKLFVQDFIYSRHMLGHPPDEKLYVSLMISAARTGDREVMLKALMTGWHIDVEALIYGTPEAAGEPLSLERDSPMYPSQELLFGIAHAFGTSSDIWGAVATIKFIADKYDIPISARVWIELLERAFVLSRPRVRGRDMEEASAGRVSSDLVRNIFTTMTAEPFNVVPNMMAWRYMIKTCMTDGTLDELKGYLQSAYELLCRTREQQKEAHDFVMRLIQPALHDAVRDIKHKGHEIHSAQKHGVLNGTDYFESPHLADAIHAYEILRLQVYQQEYLFKRSVFNAIQVRKWKDLSDEDWHHQERPKMMQEWKDFLPERIVLTTTDGSQIRFHGKTAWSHRIWNRGPNAPVRRARVKNNLFSSADKLVLREEAQWNNLLDSYPFLDDKKVAPALRRLFRFRKEPSEKLKNYLEWLRTSDVSYRDDSPLSKKMNPHGQLYGRLAALGMLKSPRKSVYRLDDDSLI